MQQFKPSFDVAALQIGRSLVLYCILAMVLTLQFMRIRIRKGLSWVIISVALLAVTREIVEFQAAGVRTDVTEPILGLMAAVLMITMACLMIHAVHCSCRLSTQSAVPYDRRRFPYRYRQ